MAVKHYEVDNINHIVKAVVVKLSEKELKEIKNYVALGYTLVNIEPPKKKKVTEEDKKNNPFSEQNVKKYLEEHGTEKQKADYYKIYNTQAKDKKTNMPAVYKTNSKDQQKFKAGDPKPKGHIATLQWFKNEFPNYPENK